jgi:hypothetical protein
VSFSRSNSLDSTESSSRRRSLRRLPLPVVEGSCRKAVPRALEKIALGTTPTGKPEPDRERLALFPQLEDSYHNLTQRLPEKSSLPAMESKANSLSL